MEFKDGDPLLVEAVRHLDDVSVSHEDRFKAEALVHGVDAEYGFFRGHGDQLTVEVWQDVISICSQEVTSFGRLEFLKPVQLVTVVNIMCNNAEVLYNIPLIGGNLGQILTKISTLVENKEGHNFAKKG